MGVVMTMANIHITYPLETRQLTLFFSQSSSMNVLALHTWHPDNYLQRNKTGQVFRCHKGVAWSDVSIDGVKT